MLAGECIPNRSNFLKGSVGLVFGLSSLTVLPGSSRVLKAARTVTYYVPSATRASGVTQIRPYRVS